MAKITPMSCSRRADLARNTIRWLSRGSFSCPEAFIFAVVSVVPVMIVSALMAYMIGFFYEVGDISKTSIYAQTGVGVARVVKTMLWTPFFENSLVALMLSMMSGWRTGSRWTKPIAIGFIFSTLHVAIANDLRPFSVFPAFIVIAFLIESENGAKLRLCGFVASIAFHSLSNSIILIPFFTGNSS